jgi:hypothetical protein
VFVTRDEEAHEVITYYATTAGAAPDRRMAYNWLEKTWSFEAVGAGVRRVVQGVGPSRATTWSQLNRTWAEINETWAQLARTDRSTLLLQLRPRAVDLLGATFTKSLNDEILAAVDSADNIAIDAPDDLIWGDGDSSVDYHAWAERNYVDLDELTGEHAGIKYVRAAYLQVYGTGRFDVQFGVSGTPREAPRWGQLRTINLDAQPAKEKVDLRLTGRYLHWRFGTWSGDPSPGQWRLSGMDLDVVTSGRR